MPSITVPAAPFIVKTAWLNLSIDKCKKPSRFSVYHQPAMKLAQCRFYKVLHPTSAAYKNVENLSIRMAPVRALHPTNYVCH
ncbi:hypothetical protein SAMN05421863_100851 [Nitrosomonas communis]|uniref:Uncharacterized protein n=1 Tax=Nitrosomonas communis TaxID=44574 RepID=A0A1I4M2U3_9PROT|nr:hypothetical protein SAMN05421863_100851 [Nitrosomonas communis]